MTLGTAMNTACIVHRGQAFTITPLVRQHANCSFRQLRPTAEYSYYSVVHPPGFYLGGECYVMQRE